MTKGTIRNLVEKVRGELEIRVNDYLKMDGSGKEIEESISRLLLIINACNEIDLKESQGKLYENMMQAISQVDMSKFDIGEFQRGLKKGGN